MHKTPLCIEYALPVHVAEYPHNHAGYRRFPQSIVGNLCSANHTNIHTVMQRLFTVILRCRTATSRQLSPPPVSLARSSGRSRVADENAKVSDTHGYPPYVLPLPIASSNAEITTSTKRRLQARVSIVKSTANKPLYHSRIGMYLNENQMANLAGIMR